jgi:hypothetical protein
MTVGGDSGSALVKADFIQEQVVVQKHLQSAVRFHVYVMRIQTGKESDWVVELVYAGMTHYPAAHCVGRKSHTFFQPLESQNDWVTMSPKIHRVSTDRSIPSHAGKGFGASTPLRCCKSNREFYRPVGSQVGSHMISDSQLCHVRSLACLVQLFEHSSCYAPLFWSNSGNGSIFMKFKCTYRDELFHA